MAKHTARWADRPAADDFTAASNYLSLQFPDAVVQRLVRKARSAARIERIAKDILRACELPLLPPEEKHVAQDIKRIHKGKPLAPLILIRGDLTKGRPLVIADGYHRMCAACHVDEDAPVAAVWVSP